MEIKITAYGHDFTASLDDDYRGLAIYRDRVWVGRGTWAPGQLECPAPLLRPRDLVADPTDVDLAWVLVAQEREYGEDAAAATNEVYDLIDAALESACRVPVPCAACAATGAGLPGHSSCARPDWVSDATRGAIADGRLNVRHETGRDNYVYLWEIPGETESAIRSAAEVTP